MQERLASLERQNDDLRAQVATSQDANECLEIDKQRIETQLARQEHTIEQVRLLFLIVVHSDLS